MTVFHDGQGIQSIRDHDLDIHSPRVLPTKSVQESDRGFVRPLTGCRMQDVIGSVRGPRCDLQAVGYRADEFWLQFRPDAELRVIVDVPGVVFQGGLQIPRLVTVPFGNKQSAPADIGELLSALLEDFWITPRIALAPTVLHEHPKRIAEMIGGPTVRVNDAQLLKELPHAVVDAIPKGLTQPDVILKSGRQISEHRVDLCRQCHQVGRVGRHDLVEAPVEIVE